MKDKMIEEMAKNCKNCSHYKVCDKKLELKYYFDNHDCEHYQPKLPKDSVVLSRELYNEMVDDVKVSKEKLARIIDSAKDKARKETAEKIYNFVERHIVDDAEVELMVKEWFKEQFGVEIKE